MNSSPAKLRFYRAAGLAGLTASALLSCFLVLSAFRARQTITGAGLDVPGTDAVFILSLAAMFVCVGLLIWSLAGIFRRPASTSPDT